MKKCYLCLISESEAVLYEGVHKKEGIVNVCRKCYHLDKMPLIEKKNINWNDVDRRKTVRERLGRMAKIKTNYLEEKREIKSNFKDEELKKLVKKNFEKEISGEFIQAEDLVDNFNWVIMRKRRGMKLSREELAEAIFEPFVAIQSLEKGVLPKDYVGLVKKIESYLGIRLFREKKFGHRDIINESRVPSGILISELKQAEKMPSQNFSSNIQTGVKKIEKNFDDDFVYPDEISMESIEKVSGIVEKIEEKKEFNKKSSDELSDEDIDNLIWGK